MALKVTGNLRAYSTVATPVTRCSKKNQKVTMRKSKPMALTALVEKADSPGAKKTSTIAAARLRDFFFKDAMHSTPSRGAELPSFSLASCRVTHQTFYPSSDTPTCRSCSPSEREIAFGGELIQENDSKQFSYPQRYTLHSWPCDLFFSEEREMGDDLGSSL